MWSVPTPSTTRNAAIFPASGDCFERCRMPSRLPSPSSPTLATSSSPRGDCGKLGAGFPHPRHRQQRRQPRPVIGNARPAEAPVGLHRDLVLIARRDDRIEVRGQRHIGAASGGGDHIAGAVDVRVPAEGAELVEEPRGALLLHEGGRRDAAELEMDLVDPLFLAGEPLETVAHPRVVGPRTNWNRRCDIGSHACGQCSRGGERGMGGIGKRAELPNEPNPIFGQLAEGSSRCQSCRGRIPMRQEQADLSGQG